MLKANRKTLIIASIVTLLPVLIGIICWNHLPDVMATHFGMNNEANGFSSKAFAVFGIPVILLAVLWFGAIVTSRDPKRQNISPKMFSLVVWIAPFTSLVVAAILYPVNLGYALDITFFVELLSGVMFIIIGNYLPKTQANSVVGIRAPWINSNPDVWQKTNRLGGILFVTGGLISLITSFTPVGKYVFASVILCICVILFVYSIVLARKKENK